MAITEFSGDFRFLSNFYDSPLVLYGREYSTVEHAFQALKTLDLQEGEQVRLARTAGVAKRLGRKVNLRPDWEDVKFDTMLTCVRAKFSQNEILGRKLLDTEDEELVEGNNWHDNEWGNCRCSKCKNIEGNNLLGKILMQIRKKLENDK